MKKVLLFATALCCMMSAQAQFGTKKSTENQLKSRIKTVQQLNRGTAAFTQKVDSIVMAYGLATVVFEYDNQYNTTKTVMMGPGHSVVTVTEHAYDSQNHRISTITTQLNGRKEKVEYTYNNLGLVEKAIQYEFEEGEWEEDELNVYEYDADGNLVLATTFDQENDVWENDAKTEYTYQNGKVVKEIQYNWLLGEWVEDQSIDYNYDAQGDLVEAIEFDKVGLEWVKDELNKYTYDANHNCTSQTEYDYNGTIEDWEIEGMVEYTFDLSVPSSDIAGLDNFGQGVLGMNNKLLTVDETSYDDGIPQQTINYTLYYSAITGLGENNEALLSVWPNPASETLSLNAEGLQQVEIFSMDGRQAMHIGNGFETVNVSSLAKGCYLLKAIFADGTKAMRKFVKE